MRTRREHLARQQALAAAPGRRAQAAAGLHRPLPRQGDEGEPGAKPHEGAGAAASRSSLLGRRAAAAPRLSRAAASSRRRCSRLDRVAVGYEPEKPVLRGLDLRLDPDDRIALLGANGNGKSTFARLIAGRLAPMAGRDHARQALRLRLFRPASDRGARSRGERLRSSGAADAESRARGGARAARRGSASARTRSSCAAHDLSGGEKARLNFALMTRRRAAAADPRRADQPSRHRSARGAGRRRSTNSPAPS